MEMQTTLQVTLARIDGDTNNITCIIGQIRWSCKQHYM